MSAWEWLRGPGLQRVFATIRKRLEDDRDAKSVTVDGLTEDERNAVADLLGLQKLPAERITLKFADIDGALRTSRVGVGLVDVIEALSGPVQDKRAEREAKRGATEAMWTAARERLGGRPELAAWIENIRRTGQLTRASNASGVPAEKLLKDAIDTCIRLPADDIALAVLAAECAGDAHALDHGYPLTNLVLRAAAAIAGWDGVPPSLAARRVLWGDVGVVCDPLSSDVLVHGLRPHASSRLSRNLMEAAREGEPVRVTLRELFRGQLSFSSLDAVYVCENPAIVLAAANALGAACKPIICLEGMPTAAATVLLRAIVTSGTTLLFRADFDWGGLRIGSAIHHRFGARPWRFTAADYALYAGRLDKWTALEGPPVAARWDSALPNAMATVRKAVFEEQIVDDLIHDLRSRPE